MTRGEAEQKTKEKFDAVDALRTERLASDEEYRRRVEAAEADAVQYQAEVERELGLTLPTRLARRRSRVLELLQQGTPVGEVARLVGASRSLVDNDVHQLTRQGLYPVPLRSPDDEEARRRNHVLRLWSYASVRTPADVAKYAGIPEATVLSDLRWLTANGYTKENAPALTTPTPTPDEVPREPTRSSTPARTPVRPPPSKVTHVATISELTRELRLRTPDASGKYALTTSKHRDHRHVAEVDAEGNGLTVPDETGHSHRISRFCIMSAAKHCHDFHLPQP